MPKDIDRVEQRERLRDEPLPHDTIIVVRGGPDTVPKILRHACRTQQRWALDGEPLTGISVFCALDSEGPASLDGLLVGRMRSYRVVHQVPVGRLLNAGFELLATAGRPHYTVRLVSDDEDAVKLLAVLGRPRDNRHHLSNARRAGNENT